MSDALFRAHQRIAAMQNELDALNHDVLAAITELAQRRAATLDEMRDSDEAATSMGQDCAALRPIAKGMECSTHAFAAIQCSGGVCSEAMDDLDVIPAITSSVVTQSHGGSRSCNLTNCGGRCGICKP